VAGMCKELNISEIVNDHIITGDQRTLSHGDAVVAMIINGLGFTGTPLYMTPQYFEDKPIAQLLGKDIEAQSINDISLGRTLDSIYKYGVSDLFSKIASNAVKTLGISSRIGHLDSTAFATHIERQKETGDGAIEIRKGHSKDYRPDLNQIALNMIVENRAKLPIYLQIASGNQSDKVKFTKIIQEQIDNLTNYYGIEYIVVDSALYTKDNIEKLEEEEIFWITRVPNSRNIVKDIISTIELDQLERIDDNYSYLEIGSNFNDINQRWIIVHNQEIEYRKNKSLMKKFDRDSKKDLKAKIRYEKQKLACETDAIKALEELKKKLIISDVEGFKLVEHKRYSTRGKPKKDAIKDITEYTILVNLTSNLSKFYEERKRNGIFILATNELDNSSLKSQDILNEYKNQQKVERGFRFLKDPKFHADSIFLKKPERIASLLMIMTLSLLVYSALEYKVRKNMKVKSLTFPNQKGKPISNPTMRWVFQYFFSVVLILFDGESQLDYFNENHETILECLGDNYDDFYY
jgi:transposase